MVLRIELSQPNEFRRKLRGKSRLLPYRSLSKIVFVVEVFVLIVISIVSIGLVTYVRRWHHEVKRSSLDLPYAHDDEPFLELVDRTYRNDELFEWEPPSPVRGDPREHGFMGI